MASFLTTGLFLRGIHGWRRFGTWLLLGSPLTLVLLVGFFLTFDPAAAGADVGIADLSSACWPSRSTPGAWPWAGWPTAAPGPRS